MSEIQNTFRDFLICYQQSAIRDTGRRPTVALREGIDRDLLLPGCRTAGYSFWQPMSWPQNMPLLGENAARFDSSITEMLSFCRFHEMTFKLPVPYRQSAFGMLYDRRFATVQNTVNNPPERALGEAVLRFEMDSSFPLHFPFAVSDANGEAYVICLQADTGECFLFHAGHNHVYMPLGIDLCRLLKQMKPSFT